MQDFFLFRSLLDAFASHGPLMQVAWLLSPVPLLWLAYSLHRRLHVQILRRMELPICQACEERWAGFPHCCVHHYLTPEQHEDPVQRMIAQKLREGLEAALGIEGVSAVELEAEDFRKKDLDEEGRR